MDNHTAYVITDPIGHRHYEAALMNAYAALEESMGIVSIVVVPDDDDDWCCDLCNTPIDIATKQILCVDSCALCLGCTASVLSQHRVAPRTPDGAWLLRPCPCPPCLAAVDDAITTGHGAEVIDPNLN